MRRWLACVVAALVLSGCTSPPSEPADEPESPSPATETSAAETAPPDPGPTPEVGECHALTFRQAVAVVGRTAPVACRRKHTAETYFVGRLDLTTKAGFTRRVDSQAAQRQMRTACTSRLPRHLGRTPRELRLSMVRAVWFDAFVTNVDRTPRNPNLLFWHKALYFIDHGASLYFHHNWQSAEAVGEMARSRFPAVRARRGVVGELQAT